MSEPAQPASGRNKQSPKEATPAGKRAVHATMSQLYKVSQAGRTSQKSPQSNATSTHRGSAVPSQTAGGGSGRVAGGRSPADAARRGRHAGRAMPRQQMPHLQAAMWGPGLRTNALLESGGSMGSGQSMQASRIAMQCIGEAQRPASRDRSRSVASTRTTAGDGPGFALSSCSPAVHSRSRSPRTLRALSHAPPSLAQAADRRLGAAVTVDHCWERCGKVGRGLCRREERHWRDSAGAAGAAAVPERAAAA